MRNLIVFVLVCAGCGVSDPMLIWEDPGFKNLRKDRLEWNVGVQSVTLAEEEIEPHIWPLTLNTNETIVNVVKAIQVADIFSEVRRGVRGADLLLRIDFDRLKARYVGGNNHRWLWFITWCFISSIPASLIADEEYEVEIGGTATLIYRVNDQPIWSNHTVVKISCDLDHFQRGISFWDLFLPGPALAEPDPDCLSSVLVPHALRAFEIEMVKQMATGVPTKQLIELIRSLTTSRIIETDKELKNE